MAMTFHCPADARTAKNRTPPLKGLPEAGRRPLRTLRSRHKFGAARARRVMPSSPDLMAISDGFMSACVQDFAGGVRVRWFIHIAYPDAATSVSITVEVWR